MHMIKAIYLDLRKALHWFITLSPTIKKEKQVLYFSLSIFLIVLFLIEHSQGNNDLTNWIIALANIVMACAAVLGVIYARRYVNDLVTKDGFKIALELKEELIPTLPPIIGVSSRISNIHHLAKKCASDKLISRNNFISLMDDFIVLNGEFLRFEDQVLKFEKLDRLLNTCNWSSSNNKNDSYIELKKSTTEYWTIVQILRTYLGSIMVGYAKDIDLFYDINQNTHSESILAEQFNFSPLDDAVIKSLCNLTHDYFHATNKFRKCTSEFIAGNESIFNYFKPR